VIAKHVYDPGQIGCLLLITSQETTLDGLIERPLDEGDVLSNANTVIHLGKIREGTRFRRAMYVTKHRGSACTDEIIPYSIDDRGLRLERGHELS
jgi:KaiC/GvpD/RAD55 family RecA-like ATPase